MFALLLSMVLGSSDVELQASVRIACPKSPTSGTVVKVIDGEAYILASGQLDKRDSLDVEFFYMDGSKLDKSLILPGRSVLMVENNKKGVDFAVIKVKLPTRSRCYYIPLAAEKVRCREGQEYRAVGCKNGKEPTFMDVLFTSEKNGSLQTKTQMDFGCSGGGMFRGGKLLGVCWGVQDGEAFFTPHYRVIEILRAAHLEFVFE
jgi:hypothetical protein